jgi:hypothetical protein
VTFAVGTWVGGEDPPPVAEEITLNATAQAPREAWMTMDVFPKDPAGNWTILAEAGGLPPLPNGGYYEVWMTKNDELASPCGRFIVDGTGAAPRFWLNAPYEFGNTTAGSWSPCCGQAPSHAVAARRPGDDAA